MPGLTRFATTAAVGLMASLAVPAFAGASSPDARDAAYGLGVYGSTSAARVITSPDVRDASRHAGVYAPARVVFTPTVDLRAPDTRDVARGIRVSTQPNYGPAVTTAPASSGFEWGDALIGAAAMLGLFAIAAGMVLLITHRGGHRPLLH